MKRLLLIALLFICINIRASVVVMDADSKRVLYSENMNEKKLIASTSKIMTSIIALENAPINKKIKVGKEIYEAYGSMTYIKEGEEFTLHSIIRDHNFSKGNYRVCFQVGQKDVMVGNKDYDIVHNVLSFEIAYNDMHLKDRIAYWPADWGSNHFQGETELIK